MDAKKKLLKKNIVNVILSLLVTAIGYYAFKYTNAPAENLFYPIIFFLVLIYLEILDKK